MCTCLAQILFTYRLTPQSTTGISPSELLLGCCPCLRLYLLKPNMYTVERVAENQMKRKEKHDQRSRDGNIAVAC